MADEPKESRTLLSALEHLGHSVADLFKAFHVAAPDHALVHQDQPPVQLALPKPEPHMEGAQVLTQHTPGWHVPHPSHLAVPSFAPAMTAFGIVFIALGAVTMWPLSVIGAAIFVLAIAKWIGELLHD